MKTYSPSDLDLSTVIRFNTGRGYTAAGQVIFACRTHCGAVVMHDSSRNLSYAYETPLDPVAILAAYDNNQDVGYTSTACDEEMIHAWHTAQDAALLDSPVFQKVLEKEAAAPAPAPAPEERWTVTMPSGAHLGTCLLGEGKTRADALEDAFGPKPWGPYQKKQARLACVKKAD